MKAEMIKLLKELRLNNNEKREELIDKLKEEYEYKETPYYNNISKKLLKEYGETGFRFYDYTRYKNYYYFVSNIGRVAIINIKTKNPQKLTITSLEGERIQAWIVPRNEYSLCLDLEEFLENFKEFSGCHFNSSTPVYNMVGKAWLREDYLIAEKIAHDKERIELHHINGDNNDCTINNLIYLPNSIHAKVHVKRF